ncbi:MarR family winged helix-turn-helix transcriptional regulator [Motilimonas sp. 1_MG-2023]|uniref:MarR family winged helix-turn-helix transcriptional regulator n=1 Tax=Motilimonas TaxID=1914248 RepID=UPI0026E391D4|nr:MarR family winged helix-turn-helix transcriptional regulator [Motilimonas sp. 1_MG-2023]MDO6525249.1 MarR family winged helix-turn-helix transcriptional regulator [Motilimonas sp. 1_MG-2023]
MNLTEQKQQRIMIQLGIIQQLMTTRTHQLFKNFSINPSEFSLLSHFSHQPTRSWTISELANVMEMNQPGITKLVASLLDKSALHAEVDAQDKRKRHLTITKQGLNLCGEIMQKLQPDISACFADWQDQELDQLLATSEKMMRWLDDNRLKGN